MPPWNESIEAMLMILPPPAGIMWRAAACERKNTDLRFTSMHRVPVGLGEIDGVVAADRAGVVDENVQAAEFSDDCRRPRRSNRASRRDPP